ERAVGVESGTEKQVTEISFRTQGPDCRIERHLVVIASEVGVELALAIALWIDYNPQPGPPVVGEGVVRRGAAHRVLFPAQTHADTDKLIHLPNVIGIPGIVKSLSRSYVATCLPTSLLQRNTRCCTWCKGTNRTAKESPSVNQREACICDGAGVRWAIWTGAEAVRHSSASQVRCGRCIPR